MTQILLSILLIGSFLTPGDKMKSIHNACSERENIMYVNLTQQQLAAFGFEGIDKQIDDVEGDINTVTLIVAERESNDELIKDIQKTLEKHYEERTDVDFPGFQMYIQRNLRTIHEIHLVKYTNNQVTLISLDCNLKVKQSSDEN